MKVTYKSNNGKLVVETEVKHMTDMFEQLGHIQDVVDEAECDKCHNVQLKYALRKSGDDPYYELRCDPAIGGCGAKLEYGIHKVGGTLYPKRKNKEGEELPNKGWIRWDSEKRCNV